MTPVDGVLERMGLAAYISRFRDEGFDTWETLMDITETDLDALDVKLGHRRKLQRAISQARGRDDPQSYHLRQRLQLPISSTSGHVAAAPDSKPGNGATHHSSSSSAGPPKPEKRKYTRHPPSDPRAPKRPSPAYVTFSNELRATMKPKLDFGEFTKLVGKHWQALDPVEKEAREAAAQRLKDIYNKELAEYKKTPFHAEHLEVLADWKLKHNASQAGAKLKRQRTGSSASGSVPASIQGVPENDEDGCASVDEYDQDEAESPSSPSYATSTYAADGVTMPPGAASRWRAALHPSAYVVSSSVLPAIRHVSAGQRSGLGSEDIGSSDTSGFVSQGPLSNNMDRSPARLLYPPTVPHDNGNTRANSSSNGGPMRSTRARSSSIPPLTRDDTLQSTSTVMSDRPPVEAWTSNTYTIPFPERSATKNPLDRTLPSLANLVRAPSVDGEAQWASKLSPRPLNGSSSVPSMQQARYSPAPSHNTLSASAASMRSTGSLVPLQDLDPLYHSRDGSGRPSHDSSYTEQQQNQRRDETSFATLLRASKQLDGETRSPQLREGPAG